MNACCRHLSTIPRPGPLGRLVRFILVGAVIFGAALAARSAPPGVPEIEKLIGELGSEKFTDREKASKRLLEIDESRLVGHHAQVNEVASIAGKCSVSGSIDQSMCVRQAPR